MNEPINVGLTIQEGIEAPTYATEGDAGFDLRAYITDECGCIVLKPGETKLIKTGICMAIPEGFELQIRPRSGLAFKHGITVLNSPGTIDSGYRGDIGILLTNFGSEEFSVSNGDRIAQGVLSRFSTASFSILATLNKTERGESGFGSSGKN